VTDERHIYIYIERERTLLRNKQDREHYPLPTLRPILGWLLLSLLIRIYIYIYITHVGISRCNTHTRPCQWKREDRQTDRDRQRQRQTRETERQTERHTNRERVNEPSSANNSSDNRRDMRLLWAFRKHEAKPQEEKA
jgi:hypothetical protein